MRISLFVTMLLWGTQSFCDVIMVTSTKSAVSTLSRNSLKKMYMGKTRVVHSVSITPMMLESGKVHNLFLEKYMDKSESSFNKLWMRLVFSGKAKLPQQFSSEKELVDLLVAVPNTIGYIDSSNLAEGLKKVEVTP